MNFVDIVFYVGLGGGIGWYISVFVNDMFNKDKLKEDWTIPVFMFFGFPLGGYIVAKIFM